MFFEKNAQALMQSGEVHRALLQQLRKTEPTTECELYPTPDGNYTLQYRGVFLHDPEQPLVEARNSFETHCTPSRDRLHLVLGIGLGYLPDHAFQASSGHLIVYEPDLPLLRFILDNVDLSELFGSGRVYVAGQESELLTLIRRQLYRQYQLDVVMLRGSAYLLAPEIPGLMDELQHIELDRVHDFKTGDHFHRQWLRQFFQNLPHLVQCDTLDRLVGKFAGKPAVVISRGPSLDAALDNLKSLADCAVLIAVGSAVRRLWEASIQPDFAVFYDANGMREQLHGIPAEFLSTITFLLSPTTQPCCFETPTYGKLVFLTQNGMQYSDWLDTIFKQSHYRLDGGGTVSLIAFQTAMAMQCSPVVLVGQDLAFPDNQVYAGGIPLQIDETGHMTLTASDTLYAEPESLDTVSGQQGETVQTLKAYKSFIRHFEDLAHKNAQSTQPAQLYNASLGGAHIEGYALRNLSAFVPEWTAWKQSHALPQAPLASEPTQHQRQQGLQAGLISLRTDLQEAIALCETIRHALQATTPEPAATLQSANGAFNRFMQAHPFVAYMAMFEMIRFRQHMNALTTDEAIKTDGRNALLQLVDTCQTLFQQEAPDWIAQAEQKLTRLNLSSDCLRS